MKRLFVALELPDEWRQACMDWQRRQRAAIPQARWTRADALHLTIRFFGSVDDEVQAALIESLSRIARQCEPATCRLGQTGVFPSPRRPRVLWVGVEGDVAALTALQRPVESAAVECGLAPESRPFRAHITLARMKSGRVPATALGVSIAGPSVPAARLDQLSLLESRLSSAGARYHLVRRWTVGANESQTANVD